MENFLATLVFLLPGFLLYFWIQSFGVNPVVKHSSIELTAISALLWLPVSVSTLAVYNGIFFLAHKMFSKMPYPIWTLDQLQNKSGNLLFLVIFLLLSVLVSFVFGALWSKFIFPFQLKIINKVRKWRGITNLSKTAAVWDEVFLKNEPQVVEYGKIGEEEKSIIGEIEKVSRTFEPEKNLYLRYITRYTELVKKYEIPVSNVFLDTKTGIYIKIYDSEQIISALKKEGIIPSD